jgi:hypothetical protein
MSDTLTGILDLVLWRDGGQRQARRNAWRAMVADNLRARERAEVADALRTVPGAGAGSSADGPVSSTHGTRGEGRVRGG